MKLILEPLFENYIIFIYPSKSSYMTCSKTKKTININYRNKNINITEIINKSSRKNARIHEINSLIN